MLVKLLPVAFKNSLWNIFGEVHYWKIYNFQFLKDLRKTTLEEYSFGNFVSSNLRKNGSDWDNILAIFGRFYDQIRCNLNY